MNWKLETPSSWLDQVNFDAVVREDRVVIGIAWEKYKTFYLYLAFMDYHYKKEYK